MYNLHDIFAEFQPIISISKKSIIGFEGLSRGYKPKTKQKISPIQLFKEARENGTTLDLDRLCREKCIEGFQNISYINDDFYLFVNIEASILEHTGGSHYFYNQIKKSGIKPQNVVIEISEAEVQNVDSIISFIKDYKSFGFLISLDDVGAGYSNYERIALAEPDIIKLDRSMVSGIDKNYFKQEIFRSLVSMSNRIGAIVVAEGVETRDELYTVIHCGAHLIQGFIFARPDLYDLNKIVETNQVIDTYIQDYREHSSISINSNKDRQKMTDDLIINLCQRVKSIDESNWDFVLNEFINESSSSSIECAYILNMDGIQVTETAIAYKSCDIRKSLLFRPATKGSDSSMKRYFYELINLKVKRYVSDPYISYASGRVCRTYSTIIKSKGGENIIVCIDILYNYNA